MRGSETAPMMMPGSGMGSGGLAIQAMRLSPPYLLRHEEASVPYMEALLGVFLKGVGFELLWPQLVWMLGLSAALFAVGAARFRRRLV